ncbi:ABC transporter ATP-binding protein [Coraliomargarita parva]|uniref:ABC transporter ATP-binding protein n=1 Tax=Coraliomargarita parva TaxID=3014050 RepID=UPI0022B34C43|nr:ATP-binding cassette domain-containing protein [Coraliomargarita parva]
MPKTCKQPILQVEELKLYRGQTRILQGIEWTVQTGEHWAILGANGCGKTSLLSAITGYFMPSSGDIRLLGERYGEADWNELRQHIGIVSSSLTRRVPADELALETVLSGGTAQLGYWTRSKQQPTEKALRCMGKMGVRRLAERPWAVLSQGERQKVFIARALMAQPKLLILDEPCAGLDPVAREQFLLSLRKLASAKRGPGLVMVTHHVEEIIPEISHVLLLRSGRTYAAGPKETVLRAEPLGHTFGADLGLSCDKDGRYHLDLI